MKCPLCGQKHFKKEEALKVLKAVQPWKHVQDYLSLMHEISASMQNDAAHNRKGAFLTRLRDYKECYFRGLWIGLVATPQEIIHDASGEKPWLTLAKLAKKVSVAIFDDGEEMPATLPSPRKTRLGATNILDPSAHFSALFLLHRGLLSDLEAKRMYEHVLTAMETESVRLRYVVGALKGGKKSKEILHALRPLLEKGT